MLGVLLILGLALVLLALRFVHNVERDPGRFVDDGKAAPGDESPCNSCVHLPEFPDCPNGAAGDSFGADEGPLYCDDYAKDEHADRHL